MAIDYSVLAIPKGVPSALTKGWKKRDAKARMQAAYDAVDKRDGMLSRVTGKPLLTNTNDAKLLRDHCHIRSRGAHPEDKFDVSNQFCASRLEHKLIHAGAIEIEGTDANQRLIFRWNRALVPVGKEPFKLLSKRRSQNR